MLDYQKTVNYIIANNNIDSIGIIFRDYNINRENKNLIIIQPKKTIWDYYGIELKTNNGEVMEINPFKP